jgi:hypothetical protein
VTELANEAANCESVPNPGQTDTDGDTWPLNINVDTYVTVGGDILPYRGRAGAWCRPPADLNWLQRFDLNGANTDPPCIARRRGVHRGQPPREATPS